MSLIEDYLRDQARDLAGYAQAFWVDPDSVTGKWTLAHGTPKPGQAVPGRYGEDWGVIERRHSIIDPAVPWLRYNPDYVGPTPRVSATTMTQAGILPAWTCSYCGGLRMASAHKCEGCGAART